MENQGLHDLARRWFRIGKPFSLQGQMPCVCFHEGVVVEVAECSQKDFCFSANNSFESMVDTRCCLDL